MAAYPYYQPYQPYYPQPLSDLRQQPAQMQPPAQIPIPQPQQSGQSFAWVDSEQDAKNWVVLPGQSMMLMSRNDSVFWIKATDASGLPQGLRTFDYIERTGPQNAPQPAQSQKTKYVTYEELEALAARVDALSAKKAAPARKTPANAETEVVDNG